MTVDMKLYDILGIKSNATQKEITKSYRKLAMKWHPDRNKSKNAEQKFKEITEAYSILNDKEKKEKYDKYGFDGMKQNVDVNMPDPSELFNMFFNNVHESKKEEYPKQIKKIDLTLEELYSGCVKQFDIDIKLRCKICNGNGSNFIITCPKCNGNGVFIKIIRMGPIIQQIKKQCNHCNGKGKYVDNDKLCKKCNGDGLISNIKKYKINISPGLEDEHYDVLKNMGSETRDGKKSHLVIIINELKHNKFKRQNNDLIYTKEILLGNSLIGAEWELTILNGKNIYIKENIIIKNNEKRIVKNYGMPIKETNKKGNLIIIYKVKYPTKILDKNSIELEMTSFKKSKKSIRVKTLSYDNYQETNYKKNEPTENNETMQCAQQ